MNVGLEALDLLHQIPEPIFLCCTIIFGNVGPASELLECGGIQQRMLLSFPKWQGANPYSRLDYQCYCQFPNELSQSESCGGMWSRIIA
jgi:hypothetical protein